MTILFLTTHLNTGGITSYLFSLSKGLIMLGCRVVVVSSGGNMENDFKTVGAKVINVSIQTKSDVSLKIYFALPKILRIMKEEKIDIIHAQTRITQVLARMLSRLTKKPALSTCHGYFKKRLFRRLFPCWGSKTIAISTQVREHLIKDFGLDENKVVLIENGIDLKQFKVADEAERKMVRQKFKLGDELLIGIIARLSEVKGQDILIQAFKKVVEQIPNAKLIIVGEGKTDAELRNLTLLLHVNKQVLFYPIVNQTSETLSLFDLFVMPSRQEGLGLSIIEAQAAGLPVVASRVGGIPTLIEDGQTGVLVDPENIKMLADAMIALLSDKNKRQTIGYNARRFVETRFSLERMAEQTLNLYKSL
jgi:glycosyltransferase involved in cell wall biosynthesis